MKLPQSRWRRWLLYLFVVFLLIQAVPYGRDHSNPPVTKEPNWVGPRTEAIVKRACYDCHSNETKWPWYSHIAPISWLVQRDVMEGRAHLNFSEMDKGQRNAKDAAHEVEEGEMPLWHYGLMHPGARLDDTEKKELIRGFKATLGTR